MKLEYRKVKNTSHIAEFKTYLHDLTTAPEIKRICEVGGGANPAISLDLIDKYGLEYTLLDISAEELAKAPNGYHKIQTDISSPSLNIDREFDLVFSIMLAEHVPNGLTFHKNVFNILRDGGYAIHVFPTMYALPFIVNQILPDKLSEKILWALSPHRKTDTNKLKFPAYYSWCRGPLNSQINKFENLGYKVEEYVGFFGTPAYFSKIKPLSLLDDWMSSILVKYPQPLITSYAYLLLRKDFSLLN
ncbi:MULTISPECIES: class I SAM-dependent methyltransferase [unclassified Tolypothrix]|uniref:class I SAM-dependent methyltransferase n=1 Tax=unclassified Tolypothrix TaxID=2649714 RepID=UPI0005EAB20C|nr:MULTISPECIES: UPF0146 family protein [unclassified Tolypothrix]BAY93089.1 transposase and inactivated derivatives-like protein [Microchaete diplosiphon NIES-3275]EKF00336.1 putative SAM-dependent methyltransferase [Tolypothrix sp. PCC 7601]MBE9081890.1 methyltransferase domain-containing protein [Tolypothrix sp. LEGE 11397]UYD26968.1 methyltransferase domain-containing protein [Tolypothrix sp. PCC 7712]UYD37173.1 methyltransferase domain-containing protein [Tolypothrix sp. PCC 7601]